MLKDGSVLSSANYRLVATKHFTPFYLSPEKTLTPKVVRFIHDNYAQELSLPKLANEFFISPSHLSRTFKKDTGLTLIHYIQWVRLTKARHALEETNAKISDIAAACGFFSFSQFNRVFQTYYQQSPSKLREKYQKNSAPASEKSAVKASPQ